MYKNVFTVVDNKYAYVGYTNGDDWNGFATPYFELAEAMEVMHEYNLDADSEVLMKYDKVLDQFCRTIDGEVEVWKGEDYNTPDGVKHLYGIGTYYWVWEEITDYDIENITRGIEDFIWQNECIDRMQTVDSIIDRLKDFNTLKQTIRILYNDDLTEELKFEKLGGVLL